MDITKLLNPEKLCVVGASEKEGFGGDTVRNILTYMDPTRVYFVNPRRTQVFGHQCYPSISDLPESVDLVILCTPQHTVLDLLSEAAAKGARAAVVYASGYAEMGTPEGEENEHLLKELCQKLDLALMGPNCAGFVNYVNNVYAFAFISEKRDRRGSVGLVSQSGQLCLSMMDSPNMKFSYIISAGNSTVIGIEDYLEYLVEDDHTKVIALYLEGVKDARRFERCLRLAAQKRKPIVVLKAGRSLKGEKIAASHTGSLAGSDRVFDAVFKKFGVIRVDDMEELLATSLMLSVLPRLPEKPTFASLNLSGGEAGICADLAHLNGIELPDFKPETQAALRSILPSFATPQNPLDMTAALSYDSEKLAAVLRLVMRDENIGMITLGYTLLEEIADPAIHYIAEAIEQVVSEGNAKPIVMIPFIENTRNREYVEKLEKLGVPVLPPAAYAFKVLRYLADFLRFDPNRTSLSLALPNQLSGTPVIRSESESKERLRPYGLSMPVEAIATTPEEAETLAEQIGFPVVLKVDSPDIPHKSDLGGVILDIQSPEAAREAFLTILERVRRHEPAARLRGVLVAQMQKPGLEVMIGVKNDPQFGPMVMVGLGGVFVEIFKDTALCPAPVSLAEAQGMIASLKSFPLLCGYRGKPKLDIEALAEAIVQVSQFACARKDSLIELDLNPVFVYEKGICIVDALLVESESKFDPGATIAATEADTVDVLARSMG